VSDAQISPAALVRGAGVAAATLSPSVAGRVLALAGTFGAAWRIRPGGLTFLSMTDPDHESPWVRDYLPLVTSGASWLGVHLGVSSLLRRRAKHPLLVGVVYGGAIATVDTVLATRFAAAKARADELARRPGSD
jgi:hypothetical protein